jgi:hypothetical protein
LRRHIHIRYSSPSLILLKKIQDVKRTVSWESRFFLCVLICRGYMITNFGSFRFLFQCSKVGSKLFIFLTLNEYVGFTRQQLPAKRWCQLTTECDVTSQIAVTWIFTVGNLQISPTIC